MASCHKSMSVRPQGRYPNRVMANVPYQSRTNSRRLQVSNLPFELKWQELKDHMRQVRYVHNNLYHVTVFDND